MNDHQRACLIETAIRANELAGLALEGERSGVFDIERASNLVFEQLGALATGFDQELDHATFNRIMNGCGLVGRLLRGQPANDVSAPEGVA